MGQEYPKEIIYESGIKYSITHDEEEKTYNVVADDIVHGKQETLKSFKTPDAAAAYADHLLNQM